MAEQSRPDLCIVGAGALGLALARHARSLGAETVLVDRGVPEPGDGPHQALRLAALSASAAQARAMADAATFGLPSATPKLSVRAVQERAVQVAADFAPTDSAERLAAERIAVLRGAPAFIDPSTVQVDDTRLKPRAVILALGGAPVLPSIPGLREIDHFTPDTILDNVRKLTHLLVIGDDPSGYVLAQAYARLGSEVTLVPQGAALAGHDAESAAILLQVLTGEGVRVIDGASIRQIVPRAQGTGAVLDLFDGGEEMLDVSHVLVAMGGAIALSELGADKARLQAGRGQVFPGPLGETGNRRVRIVGTGAGMRQWQHALRHGRAAVEALLLGSPRTRPAPEPKLVLTEPALAQIGRPIARAEKAGLAQAIIRASFAENAAALAQRQAHGLVKVMTGPGGRIAGASLVGPGAADLAAILAMAMEHDVALERLAELSLPSPSLASILVDLAQRQQAKTPLSPWLRRRLEWRRKLPF